MIVSKDGITPPLALNTGITWIENWWQITKFVQTQPQNFHITSDFKLSQFEVRKWRLTIILASLVAVDFQKGIS